MLWLLVKVWGVELRRKELSWLIFTVGLTGFEIPTGEMSLEQTREGVSVERTCTKGWQQDPKDQGLGLHTEERGEASLALRPILCFLTGDTM